MQKWQNNKRMCNLHTHEAAPAGRRIDGPDAAQIGERATKSKSAPSPTARLRNERKEADAGA
jgi:hypothetical protein